MRRLNRTVLWSLFGAGCTLVYSLGPSIKASLIEDKGELLPMDFFLTGSLALFTSFIIFLTGFTLLNKIMRYFAQGSQK